MLRVASAPYPREVRLRGLPNGRCRTDSPASGAFTEAVAEFLQRSAGRLRGQRRTGKALGSNAVVADSTQTLLCTYLSAVLLVGLVLNATLGWSWADPIAGLVIAAVAVKEGREAWRGEGCCAPTAATQGEGPAAEAAAACDDGCRGQGETSLLQIPTSDAIEGS